MLPSRRLTFQMKPRTSSRAKPDKNLLIDGAPVTPVSTLRRLEQLGKDIAGLQSELQKLADQRAHERAAKRRR